MKILLCNTENGWRGGERQTLLSLQAFQQAGHEAVLVARRGGDLAARARASGLTVYECSGPLGLVWFLLRHGRGFDVLHAQTANTLTWLALLKVWCGRPVVFTRRTAFAVPEQRRRQTYWKWQRADAFVAISQAAAHEPRAAGLDVQVIPSAIPRQPVDTTRARQFARQHGLGIKRVVATVAALTREKDPETLIRAIGRLAQVRNDFIFLHFGAEGDAAERARSLVHELKLEKQYVFAGFHDHITDLYSLMSVFVSSSSQEALGTSVLDAFLYGVPVVTTDAGGLAELAADKRALLCKVGDDRCLALGIARLLDDAGRAKSMAMRAEAYARDQHDVDKMAERYLQAYEALLGEACS